MAEDEEQITYGAGSEDYRQAEWLAGEFEGAWRYDHTAERWHHWDGRRWAPDETGRVNKRIADLLAEYLKRGMLTESLTRLLKLPDQKRALEALATFPEYGTNGDDWDQRPELLGVANGIVDLRTNALIKDPQPSLLVTKSTKVWFRPLAGPADFVKRAPTFIQLLSEWMSDDPAMVAFLLLWFGASMFGFTPEQRFLLMIGIGRNGKGTLKNAILHAVGEYGLQLDANLYMRSKFGAARSDQARADLLKLKGLRLAFFSEPSGGRFDEELLKAHTGGDQITARALYSNNIQTWEPTHSINFLTNAAPDVDDLGPSMSERVMVADFRNRYEGKEANKKLDVALRKEARGILAILCWAAGEWWRDWNAGGAGITLPDRVVEQSRAFMERNDPVANWLGARAVYERGAHAPSQIAYESFSEWHKGEGLGDVPFSQVRFAIELGKKGFLKSKTAGGMVWSGFRLLGAMALAEKGSQQAGDDADE